MMTSQVNVYCSGAEMCQIWNYTVKTFTGLGLFVRNGQKLSRSTGDHAERWCISISMATTVFLATNSYRSSLYYTSMIPLLQVQAPSLRHSWLMTSYQPSFSTAFQTSSCHCGPAAAAEGLDQASYSLAYRDWVLPHNQLWHFISFHYLRSRFFCFHSSLSAKGWLGGSVGRALARDRKVVSSPPGLSATE